MYRQMVRAEGTAPAPAAITTPLIVVSIIFPLLSAIAISLKHWAQRQSKHVLHAEDGWLWLSWKFKLPLQLSSLALSTIIWIFARSGINTYKVPTLQGTQDSLRLPLTAVKIAILLFYKRIFTKRTFAIWAWIAIALVSVWGVLFFLLILVQIDPITVSDMTKVKLRFDSTAMGLAQVGTSITLDLLVLCLPIPVITRLNMNRSRKWALVFIFWLGVFCVVAAIMRLVFLKESLAKIDANYSLVYLQDKIFIFKVIEPNASIIAACLPLYGPIIKGWRAPSSIIASIRSMVSLGSNGQRGGSSGSGQDRQANSASAEGQSELGTYRRLSEQERAKDSQKGSKISDSQS
ncbi:hypothetical protein PFICI_11970 [Pestalotiopsis fici W106-1]|uniref:Rhodopsin domain-containing protein n=1 Tax=Pestalotiopsis fici (strain W106-1 / CGMCC3.15140) TaxID=1229662 RepID=W3WRV4_PESFW|nr:uncharacterized protein PFICI_11970 [Pestalotiopsis fici W106-1]ETS76583.1 hypothetical protein PFICI_11970 [Pestalotiopsis fici W106-1]